MLALGESSPGNYIPVVVFLLLYPAIVLTLQGSYRNKCTTLMVLIATISMVLGGYGVISGLFEIMRNPATMDAGFLVCTPFALRNTVATAATTR